MAVVASNNKLLGRRENESQKKLLAAANLFLPIRVYEPQLVKLAFRYNPRGPKAVEIESTTAYRIWIDKENGKLWARKLALLLCVPLSADSVSRFKRITSRL